MLRLLPVVCAVLAARVPFALALSPPSSAAGDLGPEASSSSLLQVEFVESTALLSSALAMALAAPVASMYASYSDGVRSMRDLSDTVSRFVCESRLRTYVGAIGLEELIEEALKIQLRAVPRSPAPQGGEQGSSSPATPTEASPRSPPVSSEGNIVPASSAVPAGSADGASAGSVGERGGVGEVSADSAGEVGSAGEVSADSGPGGGGEESAGHLHQERLATEETSTSPSSGLLQESALLQENEVPPGPITVMPPEGVSPTPAGPPVPVPEGAGGALVSALDTRSAAQPEAVPHTVPHVLHTAQGPDASSSESEATEGSRPARLEGVGVVGPTTFESSQPTSESSPTTSRDASSARLPQPRADEPIAPSAEHEAATQGTPVSVLGAHSTIDSAVYARSATQPGVESPVLQTAQGATESSPEAGSTEGNRPVLQRPGVPAGAGTPGSPPSKWGFLRIETLPTVPVNANFEECGIVNSDGNSIENLPVIMCKLRGVLRALLYDCMLPHVSFRRSFFSLLQQLASTAVAPTQVASEVFRHAGSDAVATGVELGAITSQAYGSVTLRRHGAGALFSEQSATTVVVVALQQLITAGLGSGFQTLLSWRSLALYDDLCAELQLHHAVTLARRVTAAQLQVSVKPWKSSTKITQACRGMADPSTKIAHLFSAAIGSPTTSQELKDQLVAATSDKELVEALLKSVFSSASVELETIQQVMETVRCPLLTVVDQSKFNAFVDSPKLQALEDGYDHQVVAQQHHVPSFWELAGMFIADKARAGASRVAQAAAAARRSLHRSGPLWKVEAIVEHAAQPCQLDIMVFGMTAVAALSSSSTYAELRQACDRLAEAYSHSYLHELGKLALGLKQRMGDQCKRFLDFLEPSGGKLQITELRQQVWSTFPTNSFSLQCLVDTVVSWMTTEPPATEQSLLQVGSPETLQQVLHRASMMSHYPSIPYTPTTQCLGSAKVADFIKPWLESLLGEHAWVFASLEGSWSRFTKEGTPKPEPKRDSDPKPDPQLEPEPQVPMLRRLFRRRAPAQLGRKPAGET